MNPTFLATLLFISGAVTDFTWAIYIKKLAASEACKDDTTKRILFLRQAGFWSVCTGICTVFLIDAIITNTLLSIFWLAGLYFGTRYSHEIGISFKKYFGNLI